MTSRHALKLIAFVLLVFTSVGAESSTAQRSLPNPVLYMTHSEPITTGGKQFIRYKFDVMNKDVYPNTLFAAAPALPPCGTNKNSARTWVDVYNQSGKRLNGFCALGKSDDLGSIWFALPVDEVPPSYVYIELHDRQTDTKYKSNLADTTM